MPSLPTQIGRYEVRDRLGVGGMGVVYLATDPSLRRTVAIKVLSSVGGESGNEELRERFAREARSVAALKHHNIVTIYDIGEDEGRPFIAMEFVDGETLGELIRRRAELTVSRKLQLMGELCAGLGYAHRSGIVHRDIKPANLMITAEGTLKILDFGLARVTAELTTTGLTRHGALMGTPFYMSPEQIDGTPIDHRSDIFSVGLVLYEMLAFRKAFPGDSSPVVLHDIIHRQPTAIRDLFPGIDPELERVVTRGLEKDRERRYQHLTDLASDLDRIRARLRDGPDETLIARRIPDPEQVPPRLEGSGPTPRSGSRSIPNLGAIAERRAAQIETHLARAAGHLEGGRFDEVIEQCEHVLVLNPQENRALEMLERAHRGNEDRRVAAWLDEARGQLSREALTGAEALIDQTLALRPDLPNALELRRQIRERRREKELTAERNRALQMALQRTRANLEAGALEAALRTASETLAYDPVHAEARALREQIQAAIDERRRGQEREQEREQAAHEARARRDDEERRRREDERRRDAEPLLERTQNRPPEPDLARPHRDRERAAEPIRRVSVRAIAAASIVGLLLAVAAIVFFGSSSAPPPPDSDVAARTAIERATTLYANGQINDAIALLRGAQPPHALVTQQLNDWERESEARAAAVVAEARKMFDSGQRAEAIDQLTAFQPTHPTVSAAIAELREAWGRGQVTAEIEQRVKAAQDWQRRGQDRDALREVLVGLALKPDHPELMNIKRAILDGAAGRVDQSRRLAMKVPGASARDDYQTGVADERRAQSLRDDQPDQALTLYATAAQRFGDARSQQELANRNRDELLKWEAARRGELAGALKQRRWDEAERIEREIRAKAPGASGLDEARTQIAQGRQADAAAMNKPAGGGGTGNIGTGGGTTGRGTGTTGGEPTGGETAGGRGRDAAAAAARALAARQIFEAIDRFDAAVETRRIEAVSQAWPKMPREHRQYFEDLFRRQNRIVWELPQRDVSNIKWTGDSVADVEIPLRAVMIGIRNEKTVRSEIWRFKLTGAATGWSIVEASR